MSTNKVCPCLGFSTLAILSGCRMLDIIFPHPWQSFQDLNHRAGFYFISICIFFPLWLQSGEQLPRCFSVRIGPCVWHFRRLHANFWFNCVNCISWHIGHWQSALKQSPNHKLKTIDMVCFYWTDKIGNMCCQDHILYILCK